MSLLKGREMVFKAFESGIFSKLKESEQSEQSSDDVSLENKIDLNDADSTDNKLFTPIKKRTGIEILTPNQVLQRLPMALAQVKGGNNSQNLLNEIRQIVHSLYKSK